MNTSYQCIICQNINTSTMSLYNHHIQYHSPEELSQTIINLHGFKILENTGTTYLKPMKVGDNNNNVNNDNDNVNLYKHLIINAQMQNNNKCTSNQVNNSTVFYNKANKKFGHDKTSCLKKCGQFITWEQELNKRKEINDEEFSNIIEQLCGDLSKKKHRGRKRKIETKSSIGVAQNDENMVTHDKIVNNSDPVPSQVSAATSSSCNIKDSTNNMVNNDNIVKPVVKNIVNTENNDSVLLPLTNTDINKNVLIYDPLTDKFSWSSILIGVSYDEEAKKYTAFESQ